MIGFVVVGLNDCLRAGWVEWGWFWSCSLIGFVLVVSIEWVPAVGLTGWVRLCRFAKFLVWLIVWVCVGGFSDWVSDGWIDSSGL